MTNDRQLYDRLAHVTARIAKHQARELVAAQREAVRHREAQRRKVIQRKGELGGLVYLAGCEDLPDGEIVAALLNYQEGHRSSEMKARARTQGDAHLAAVAAGCVPRKH